jgi:hypothetical protein
MKILAGIAIALVVVAGAAAATSSKPKKQIIPALQAKAKAINVKVSDFPKASWKANPPDSSNSDTPTCSFYNPDQSDLTENADADSPQFTLPSSSFVSSNTSFFKTDAQGRTAYARVVQPKLPLCLAQIFQKGAGGPSKVKIVSAAAKTFPKVPGMERSNAYRIAADFKQGKQVVHTYLDVVVMNRAKIDIVIFFAGIGGSFNDSFEQSVAGKVAARAANA